MNQNKPKRITQTTTTRQIERLIFDHTPIIVGRWKSRFKILDLNVSGTNRDVVPKQRYDGFPSVGDHIHATANFEYAWGTPVHNSIEGS